MEKVKEMINKNFDTAIESWKYLVEEDNLYLIGRLEECQNAKHTVNRIFEQYGHGEWIFINEATSFYEPPCGDTCKCSECQYIIDVADTKFNYCPNCGADMRGANKNV